MFYAAVKRLVVNNDGAPVPPFIFGPESSSLVQLIATVSELAEVPLLAFSATSPYLSSKDDYPSIWRTCMSDEVQTQAWTDLCVTFCWNHAIVLVESTLYSQGAAEYFNIAASRAGVTVTTIEIDNGATTTEPRIREAMEKIRQSGVKIIFAPISTLTQMLIDTAIEEQMFGPSSFERREEAETIQVSAAYPLNDALNSSTYSITLPANTRRGDPRVQGYVWNMADNLSALTQQKYSPFWQGTLAYTEPAAQVIATFNKTKYAPYLKRAYNHIDALYAEALNVSSLSSNSPWFGSDNSDELMNKNKVPLSSLLTPSLGGLTGSLLDTAAVSIYSDYPAAIVRGLIMVYDIIDAFYKLNNRFPTEIEFPILMKNYRRQNLFGARFSFDKHQEYSSGQLSLMDAHTNEFLHSVATWTNKSGFLNLNQKKMVWPDGTNRVPDDGYTMENYLFNSYPLGVILILLTVMLLIGLLATAVGLYKFWTTPVFRLATPQLLAMMLVGLFMVALSVGGNVGRPSPIMCTLVTWPYYVGATLIYSPLIMKTYRVYHIFNSADQFQRSTFSTKRLILLTSAMASIPIILSTIRPIVSPSIDYRSFSPDATRVEVRCLIKYYGIAWAQLGLIAIQMLAAMFLAWKTRSVPDGFNESRYVFLTTYAMCTVGLLGLVVSFLVDSSNSAVAAGFLAMSSLLSTGSCWALLFLPKLHLAIFRPEKNSIALIKENSSKKLTMDDVPLSVLEIDQSTYEATYEAPSPTIK